MPRTENSSAFIIQKVAPLFNSKGYVGTSLSDLTEATGMTKGALYCNFENKEDIALAAFRHNVNEGFREMNEGLSQLTSPYKKLKFICEYYQDYYEKGKARGGCPVVNVGVDSRHNNPKLFQAVQKLSAKLVENLEKMIREGQKLKEIRKDIDPHSTAQNIYSMIQGGIFMAQTHNDESYLRNITGQALKLVKNLKR